MKHTWLACMGLLVLGSLSAQAATRTMTFVGGAMHANGNLNYNPSGTCSIYLHVIRNSQRIDEVKFVNINGTALAGAGQNQGYVNPILERRWAANGTVANTCIGSTLSQGDVCQFEFSAASFQSTTYHSLCTGYIKVTDMAAPGSVIASGSIIVSQESRVVGGALSAALLDSGNFYRITNAGGTWQNNGNMDNTGLTTTYNTLVGGNQAQWANAISTNMNPFCALSCFNKLNVADKGFATARTTCERLCDGWQEVAAAGVTNSIIHGRIRGKSGSSNNGAANMAALPNNAAGAADANANQLSNDQSSSATFMRSENYGAAAHMAGGVIKEIIIGPRSTICQGNVNYNATDPAVQPLKLFNSVPFANMTAIGAAQTLKLVCQTRGGLSPDDLLSNTTESISFQINSGNPF